MDAKTMEISMAAYNAIAVLIDDTNHQLKTFIQQSQLTSEELKWFQEDLWIEQPGAKILKMIQASSNLPLKEGYHAFLLALATKLSQLQGNSETTISDQFILITLASVGAIFPPVVNDEKIPTVLSNIMSNPILTHPQMSEKLLRAFGNIVEHAELAGINIFPTYLKGLKPKLTVEAFFERLQYIVTSPESLVSFIESLPQIRTRFAQEELQSFYTNLYKLFKWFSFKHAAEHRCAIQICNSDLLMNFISGILQFDKGSYIDYPLIAFLIPFAMKKVLDPNSQEQKDINQFLHVITKKKPKQSVVEYIYQAIIQLMFFTHTYPGPVSEYFKNQIKATEQNIYTLLSGKRDPQLQSILPQFASFETTDANCSNWTLARECMKSRAQGIDFVHLMFKSYPMPYDLASLPKKVLHFITRELIKCEDERAVDMVVGKQRFETSMQISKTEISLEQLFPSPPMEIFIRELLNLNHFIQFIENSLKKMVSLQAPPNLYLLLRNLFLPYDVWNFLKDADAQSIIPTLDNMYVTFYNTFLEMYKKSLYNTTQVASIFLQSVIWLSFIIKDRKEQAWKTAVPIIAAICFDSLLIIEMFGLVSHSIIDKIRLAIKNLTDSFGVPCPQLPTKEFNEILLWLPFTQVKIQPIHGLKVSLKYGTLNNIFISRVFEMIKIDGAIIDSFKNIRPEAINMVEDRLIETTEKMILSRYFNEVKFTLGLIKVAMNLVKAEKFSDVSKRRHITANILRIMICADYGTDDVNLVKTAMLYIQTVYTGEESSQDDTVLILLLEFIFKYCNTTCKLAGNVKLAVQALGAICESVSFLNILNEEHNTAANIEKNAKKTVFSVLSTLLFVNSFFKDAITAKDGTSVNDAIIETIRKLLQKNFEIAFDICFQLISETTNEFKQLIILAITEEFDPQRFGYGMLVTKLDYGNYAMSVNRINVTFNSMVYSNTRSYKAALQFLSYFNLHMEYFKYVMNPNRNHDYDWELFLQAFFDFCFTEENLKQIYTYYKQNNPQQMIRYIAQNPTIVRTYEILRETFSKCFTDNFLRKFLNEPNSYNASVEKGDSQPCGQFTQDIKTSSYLDQVMSESMRIMGEYNHQTLDFNEAYNNFLEYCHTNSSFDTLHVYGENINHQQVVMMRDANVMVFIGSNKGIPQLVVYLDRIKNSWKSAENMLHYVQMHLITITDCEVLVDCSLSSIDVNVGRSMVSGLKLLSSKVRQIYLLNVSEEVLSLLDVACPPDGVMSFTLVNYDEAIKQFPNAKIPITHNIGLNSPGSFCFKHFDNGMTVTVSQTGVTLTKNRLFFRKEVQSNTYLSLAENSDKTDEKEKRASNTIYEFWMKHAKKTRTMPFDMNFCFAELLVALSDKNPRTRTEIYAVITKVIGKHNSVAKYDFTNNILSIPATSISDVSFFPHFIDRLLSTAPEKLNEFHFVIKFCVDKLQQNQLSQVALTLNKYPLLAVPVLHAATRPEVMISMAECLLELNNTRLACILTNRVTVPHLIKASRWHSFGYSESLAKILNELLLYDKDIDTPNNILCFAAMHSIESSKESFEVFARLTCVAHLLYFEKNLQIPLHCNPDFLANALSVVTDSTPFMDIKSIFNYFCRSIIEPPSAEIFVNVMNLLTEPKNDPFFLEYALATLERVIDAVPKRRPHLFILAVLASRNESEAVRVRAISLLNTLLSTRTVLDEAVTFVERSDISRLVMNEVKMTEKPKDGILLIVNAMFKCFAEITNVKVVNEFVKKVLTTQRAFNLSAFMLHQLSFTQEAVDPPPDPEFCPFLIQCLQEQRCRGQIPRICRCLCDIRKKFGKETESFCSKVTEIAIGLLENEIKPSSFGALGTLLGTFSSGFMAPPMIAKAATMATISINGAEKSACSIAPIAGIILRINV